MDESHFAAAVANKAIRPELQAALHGDPILLQRARNRVTALARMHEVGQVFDRDYISKEMHRMLSGMIAVVDARKAEGPQVTIE